MCALLAAALMVGGVGLLAAASSAGATGGAASEGEQVCSGLDSGKIDVSGEKLSVTVTAPEGKLISGYCVKAGSTADGNGPEYVTLASPQKTITLTYEDSDGKALGLSHYSLSYVDAPDEGGDIERVTPTVVFTNPTCANPTASWQGFVDGNPDNANDGVTFAVTSGSVAPGATVTVTATAQTGYDFAGEDTTKTFTHTFTAVPTGCDDEGGDIERVTPTVVFTNPTCANPTASWQGFVDGNADNANDGVTFAVTSASVAPGATVTVTATAQTGYDFAGEDTTKTFTDTFTAVPTGCDDEGGDVVTPPGVSGGPGTGTTVLGPQSGVAAGSGTSGTVPTVVQAGLSDAEVMQAGRTRLGQTMIAAGLVLLLGSVLWQLRRSGGAHRA